MTANESFDRRLAGWLESEAQGRVADHLAEVLLATRVTRQRPGWASLERWLPVASIAQQRFSLPRPVLTFLVLAALILAAAAAYLLVIGRPSPPPFGLAQNGRIVYVDGDEIVSAPSEGFSDRLVAGRMPGAHDLAISPDGRLVAYATRNGIYISPIPDGGDPKPGAATVTASGMTEYGGPKWSPAGDRIAFVGADPRSDRVFLADADGSNVREIGLAMIGEHHVVWLVGFSPDGRWIAFVESPDPGVGRLVIVGPDGTGAQALPTSPINMGDGANAVWSPDRAVQRVLYLTSTGSVRYYDIAQKSEVTVGGGFWPSWSPTGDRIAYWSNGTKIVTTPVGGSRSDPIEVFPSFTGNCQDHPELAGAALCGPVTWSPDGIRVIGTEITGNGLLSLRSDGSGVPVLFNLDTDVNPGEGGFFAWQPVYPK